MEVTIHSTEEKTNISFQLLFRVIVSVAICLFLFYKIDWSDFLQQMKQVDLRFIIVSFLFVLFCIFISGYKWYILCRQARNVSFLQCFRWYYIGFFFNNFLPGSIGGDSMRIYYASKRLGASLAFASVTVERFFAGIALIVTSVIGLVFINGIEQFFWHITIFGLIALLLYCLLFVGFFQNALIKLFGDRLKAFYEMITVFQKDQQLLSKLFFHSLLFQISFVLVTDMLFRAFGLNVSFLVQLGFVSLISILTMLPISINGLGIREGAYVYLFSLVGVAETISVAVSILFFILVLIGTSAGALFWIFERKEVKQYE